jgi:hypothetical protein
MEIKFEQTFEQNLLAPGAVLKYRYSTGREDLERQGRSSFHSQSDFDERVKSPAIKSFSIPADEIMST